VSAIGTTGTIMVHVRVFEGAKFIHSNDRLPTWQVVKLSWALFYRFKVEFDGIYSRMYVGFTVSSFL